LTVLTFAKETYAVQKGDWVLLHAAAGGAGFLMTQILKNIGAKVIGTAGGPEKCALVKSLGADVVIDYRSEEGKDWVKLVKEATGGRGVDVVYDSVGKDTWEGSLEAVKRKGTIVWFGNASGPVPPIALPYVFYVFSCLMVKLTHVAQQTLSQVCEDCSSHSLRLHRDP
jgi:NADPH2:quinone reductase